MAIERSPELEELGRTLDAAVRRRDLDVVRASFSNDDCFVAVGSDADEVWETPAEAMQQLEVMADQAESGELDSSFGELRAYRSGDVGWIVDLSGSFKLADGTLVPNRGINIVHREAGEWKLVFSMAAIPVPNAMLDPQSAMLKELALQKT
jgi:ketosteroid isomerase-like protein